tara:strand:- start:195 stop:473 length:279 start_codon:yes stop_codon:yes gene_type:complete
MLRRFTLLLATTLMLLSLSACGTQINKENFDRIEDGMSYDQVTAILGDPTEATSTDFAGLSGGSAEWVHEDKRISIKFINGKVRFKSFDDGQ